MKMVARLRGCMMPEMSPIEFAGALAVLRWTGGQVATWCGYSRQSGVYWQQGRHRIPSEVVAWIDQRLAGDLVDPPRRG